MASIEKTYISGKEYPQYRTWWIDNYYKMKRELGEAIWLYTFDAFYPNEPDEVTPDFLLQHNEDLIEFKNRSEFAIWNTPESTDKWLIKNCNIPSFRNRMLEVYNYKWKGFRGETWIPKPKIKQKCNK